MAEPLHDHLRAKGVKLVLNDGVKGFAKNSASGDGLEVTSGSGVKIACDIVVMAIGVRPETKLAKEANIELGKLGGIKVDDSMRTSDPNIWACGDCVEVRDVITGEMALIPLAGPANRQVGAASRACAACAEGVKGRGWRVDR